MHHNDIKKVKQVAKLTWEDAYSHFLPIEVQQKTLEEAYSEETMNKRFNHSTMFVVEKHEEIIGYAFFSVKKEDGEALLESIYIRPNQQNEGIGTRLIQHGIKELQPLKKLSLHVMKGNKKSLLFYKAKGFKEEKEFEHHFQGHPVTWIRMYLDI